VSQFLAAALLTFAAEGADAAAPCSAETFGEIAFVVCEVDPRKDDVRLFLNDAAGAPFGHFEPLGAALAEKGERLVFAMNAGMYHKDRTPVGLYVERGDKKKKLSTKDGPGNFHLKPNGVFWISTEGDRRVAHVTDTETFKVFPKDRIDYATQSGSMLVIDGAVHPKFLPDSTSRKRRNGVGVREDGSLVFVIADTPVTFHEFAGYFRDALKTQNALYLDGAISRLYAPDLGRNDPGRAMGPIVGVVVKAE
jgi:uncharacterized protein YigE (DUF2233 family)